MAEVIDSVYYATDATENADIGSNLVITSAMWSFPFTSFDWSGGSGLVSIFLSSGGPAICSSNGNSCNGGFNDDYSGQDVYAKDSVGNKSSDFTVN